MAPSLRLSFAVVLLAVTICGAAANLLALKLGVESLPVRTAVALLASYICLFLTIRIWLAWHVRNESKALEDAAEEKDEAKIEKKTKWYNWLDIPYIESGQEFLILLLFLFVFIIVGLAFSYVIAEGGIILAEAAFEYAFFVGLLKATRHYSQDWYRHVFTKTIKPFLILLVVTTMLMNGIAKTCPEEYRLGAIIKQCWLKK